MTPLTAPDPGGHLLPAHLAGPVPTARRRRPRRGVVLALLGALIVVGGLGGLQLTASLGYDDSRAQFAQALDTAEGRAAEIRRTTYELISIADAASQLVELDSGMLTDPQTKEQLAASVASASETTSTTGELLDEDLPDAEAKPVTFWDLFAASTALRTDAEVLERLDTELADESPALDAASSDLMESGLTFLGSAADAAAPFEAAHISAKNDDVIALRNAAASVSEVTALDEGSVSSFTALQDAAAQVVTSENAELAEKAGPLQGVRLEVEAFARSLAPGVLIEFDWSPVVNGAGYGGSMGGLTTWWWDEPDRALIELSDSVAAQWPAERSRALVAHEVGHAISVKCEGMYDASTQDSIEKWATAWAIGMGFSDDANGVSAYGYPPQSYIDAALACR
ncbi:hypothetical protein [Microbacterium foliorum]|uniref:hypothetical protein n=1 Tax=Microbacterium foliorum TaxID=104336 RepID=UPI0028D22EFB|nr:hypothetical protein [Microbacterium foliorum]